MNPLNYSLGAQAKALVAGLIAALTYLVALDLPAIGDIVLDDWLEALLAFLVGYVGVFAVPNSRD